MSGCLYVVATPIGHRDDMTLRAIDTLKSVDLIAAEDTRHSHKLLAYHAINTPLLSLHAHNEARRVEQLTQRLLQGLNVALISDAGTPLISDPGYRLVAAMHEAGIKVVPIPGACAAIAALSVAGVASDRFVFEGFLPAKGAVRRQRLLALRREERSIIFYESVHRIMNLLDLLVEVFGCERQLSMARELTKLFECVTTATAARLRQQLREDATQQKGEFVVIVQGFKAEEKTLDERDEHLLRCLLAELPLKQAVALAAKVSGGSKKALYNRALELKCERG